jgi:hypothetical protein
MIALMLTNAIIFGFESIATCPSVLNFHEARRNATNCPPYSTHLTMQRQIIRHRQGRHIDKQITRRKTYSSTASELSSLLRFALPSFMNFSIWAAPRTARKPADFI